MRRLVALARFDEHVLILGESGTGKELAARALWALSGRARGPLVDRSAATLPRELVEAEVFGNRKDYPNPGMPESEGLLGAARAGVLFLDEIGEISPAMQAAFLRVFDPGASYQRLGDPKPRRAEVRFVCATNRAPAELKHDFAARLSLRVELPPLDARREDIPLLARQLVLEAAARSPAAAERFVRRGGPRPEVSLEPALLTHLLRREYPANVRDLARVLREAIAASRDDTLRLPPELEAAPPAPAPAPVEADASEAARIRATLDRHHWHRTAAAAELGVTRYALARAIKKHGLGDAH